MNSKVIKKAFLLLILIGLLSIIFYIIYGQFIAVEYQKLLILGVGEERANEDSNLDKTCFKEICDWLDTKGFVKTKEPDFYDFNPELWDNYWFIGNYKDSGDVYICIGYSDKPKCYNLFVWSYWQGNAFGWNSKNKSNSIRFTKEIREWWETFKKKA